MSLRDDCIEAATDEFRTCMADDELLGQIPVRVLDAILDALEANAEEWDLKAWVQKGHENLNTLHFIAALRDTVAGPEETP